ncbi:MAG: tetratricopeptide repeat protein [Bdellovibrionales bacterium]
MVSGFKNYNLSFEFDENLREVLTSPADARMACLELREKVDLEQDPHQRALWLAELGTLQRMLGDLIQAERSLSESLHIFETKKVSLTRLVAARIRLAHVFQWQKRYAESDQLLEECIEAAKTLEDNGSMLGFALQHMGKSRFDQTKYETALKCFYDAMMIRVRLEQHELADSSRLALNRTVELLVPRPSADTISGILQDPLLPEFVRFVLGKSHTHPPLPRERSNCINAVLNFFSSPRYRYQTASTSEALSFLQDKCSQLPGSAEKAQLADIVVFWSRSHDGAWIDRKIHVAEMNPADPEFPYGLVFEHMAVVVEPDLKIIFHKPSPAIEVPYKIEFLDAAIASLKYCNGFEITLHRIGGIE